MPSEHPLLSFATESWRSFSNGSRLKLIYLSKFPTCFTQWSRVAINSLARSTSAGGPDKKIASGVWSAVIVILPARLVKKGCALRKAVATFSASWRCKTTFLLPTGAGGRRLTRLIELIARLTIAMSAGFPINVIWFVFRLTMTFTICWGPEVAWSSLYHKNICA